MTAMKPALLYGLAAIALAASVSISSAQDTLLETGSVSIGGSLRLETFSHKLGDDWTARRSGDKDINYDYTFHLSTPGSPSWEHSFGQTLFLNIGFRPLDNLYGDLGLEFIAQYADRYWMPVNLEHRMYSNDASFYWKRADIKWDFLDWANLRYFRNVGHFNWQYEGDLFDLYPAQNESEKYVRVSGRPVPEGWEMTAKGKAGKLDLIYGTEAIWDYRNGVYANYGFTLLNRNMHLIYRNHIIPYGDPDERMQSAEISGDFFLMENPLQVGILYQPFRLNRDYVYVEDAAPGAGYLGTSYERKTGTTGQQDALGFSSRLSIKPKSIFSQMSFQYTYRGLVAGNRQEVNAQFMRTITRNVQGAVEYTYRKPLLGPLPLVNNGTSGNTGPSIFSPRGPESPFWVGWDQNLQGTDWNNREASIMSAVITFDQTPGTWFYRYQPNIPEEWNINPEENSHVAFAGKYTLTKYFTATDRLRYWNEYSHTLWEPPFVTGAWPTSDYMGEFKLLSVINIPRWAFIVEAGAGESLATTSFAYRTTTEKEKPSTGYYFGSVSAKTGPWRGKFRYAQDHWGPEDWHRMFGQTFDQLYQLCVSRDLGEYINAGIDYTAARETDRRYFASELGNYDEIHCFVTLSFGPYIPYFGSGKPETGERIGESPESDVTPPQVALTVSTTTFNPEAEGLKVLPWASDISGIAKWNIAVKNRNGKVVRNIGGDGQPPYSVEWDGIDDVYNAPVPDGEYTLELSATDENGNSAFAEPRKVAVSVPPKVMIKEVIREVPKEIKVTETERGLKVSLTSRFLFDTGKSALKPAAEKPLAELIRLLETYPGNRISVEGHTDSVGNDDMNQKLSEKRANSVAGRLIKAGIQSQRITVTGFGKTRPAASNKTAAGREANRRVEVIILK